MKTKLVLLCSLMVLQSCYSYRLIEPDYESLLIGKRYRINHLEYGKFKKGTVISKNESTLKYKLSNGRIDVLDNDGILQMKKRHFSWIKTIVLPVTIAAMAFGSLLLIVGESGIGIGEIDLGY